MQEKNLWIWFHAVVKIVKIIKLNFILLRLKKCLRSKVTANIYIDICVVHTDRFLNTICDVVLF